MLSAVVVVFAVAAFGANAQYMDMWDTWDTCPECMNTRNWQDVFMWKSPMSHQNNMMWDGMYGMDTEMTGMWGKKCKHSQKCINKVDEMTDIAATKVCSASTYGKWQEMKHCCKAGAMVGKTVGQWWSNVCMPAKVKFQQKTAQCTENWNHCKQTFATCCHQQQWRKTDMMMSPMMPEMMMMEDMQENVMLPW